MKVKSQRLARAFAAPAQCTSLHSVSVSRCRESLLTCGHRMQLQPLCGGSEANSDMLAVHYINTCDVLSSYLAQCIFCSFGPQPSPKMQDHCLDHSHDT